MEGLIVKGLYNNEEFKFRIYEESGYIKLENKDRYNTFFKTLDEIKDFFIKQKNIYKEVRIGGVLI